MPAIDPFALFCAYHLGFDVAAPARPVHLHAGQVAKRFGVALDVLEAELTALGMAPARMIELDFDVAGARFDLEASPPGVDLIGIAAMHYDAFLSAQEKPRDWEAELRSDAEVNDHTFKR